MYFKVNTSDPYRAQKWTKRADRHPLKTASLLIFLNSPLRSLAGGLTEGTYFKNKEIKLSFIYPLAEFGKWLHSIGRNLLSQFMIDHRIKMDISANSLEI